MNRNSMRIAACALAGTFALSGYYNTSIYAKGNQTTILPAAGIAVVLEEGTTIQQLTEEVIQNIAYLESASGIQPNIVIASEKIAMAELPETGATEVASEMAETFPEVALEKSAENTTETAIESEEEETSDEENKEEDSLKTSAGFSAIDVFNKGEQTSESAEEETTETTTEITDETEENTEETTTEEQTDEQDFSGLVIAQVNNYVNVRSLPSEDGEIVGKLYDKSVGEFIEEVDGWYKITSGNCTGYVKAEYCVTGDDAQALAKKVGTTYAIVNTTTLKVRQEASTESSVLGLVPIEEELVVVEELDGWVKVAIEEGDGYVSKDYVNLRTDFVHAESKEEEQARLAAEEKAREEARAAAQAAAQATEAAKAQQQATKNEQNAAVIEAAQNTAAASAGSEMGKAVIDYATQFVGNPYVYGGSSLTNGTDCSGFVMSVYANFGVSLPHSSSALRSKGYDVGGLENAQPGDIVCYSGHVALYVGNGQIVHASTSKTGIIVSNANYRNILTVRRIF